MREPHADRFLLGAGDPGHGDRRCGGTANGKGTSSCCQHGVSPYVFR
jgi:hypothetical protein